MIPLESTPLRLLLPLQQLLLQSHLRSSTLIAKNSSSKTRASFSKTKTYRSESRWNSGKDSGAYNSSMATNHRLLIFRISKLMLKGLLDLLALFDEFLKHWGFENFHTSRSAEYDNSWKSISAYYKHRIHESKKTISSIKLIGKIKDFDNFPVLNISGLYGGKYLALRIAVPLYMTKFAATATMDANQFFQRWRGLEKPDQQSQSVFKTASIDREAGMFHWLFTNSPYCTYLPVASGILSSCGLTVLEGVDPNGDNHVAAGIIHSTATIGVLLRLEPNAPVSRPFLYSIYSSF